MPTHSSLPADPNPVPIESIGLEHMQRLKQHYPDSVVITEFMTYAANEYAVRALVQVGNQILATGMAASATLETAEDRARVRAIEALGIHGIDNRPFADHTVPPAPLTAASVPPEPPLASTAPSPATAASSRSKPAKPIKASRPQEFPLEQQERSAPEHPHLEPQHSNWHEATVAVSSSHDPTLDAATALDSELPGLDAPLITSEEATLSMTHEPNSDTSSKITTNLEPPHQPVGGGSNVNLLDAIAKTSVEMHRLGWDTHQGRQHLQVTYGKRSRGELTDDELLDFLQFLEKQPNPKSL